MSAASLQPTTTFSQTFPTKAVVTALHTSPKYIIVALDDGNIHVLDSEGKNGRVIEFGAGPWTICSWNDEWLVIGGTGGICRVWGLGDLQEKIQLHGHTSTVRCIIALSSNSVLTGSRDTTLKIWNTETGECETTLEGHSLTVRSIARHGDIVVSASYDHDARIWSLEQKKCLHILKGHTAQLYEVAFDGRRIVTGSLDKTARVWDPESGTCLAVLEGYTSLVSRIQLLPSTVLTGDAGSFLRLWSTETYGQIWSVEAGQNSITALKSVGSKIVTGSSDGSVKLWDLESGTLLKELASSDAAWQVDVVGDKIIALVSRMGEVVLEVSHHSALKSFLERVDWLMGFDVDVGTIQFRLKAGECRDVLRR